MARAATTRRIDVSVQHTLDQFVRRIVTLLPITSAGLTLVAPGAAPRCVAASDWAAFTFERMQTDLLEGPCLAACESGKAVVVPELGVDGRFPRFAEAARSAGLAAVFTFPMCHTTGCLGALDLYRDVPGALDHFDLHTAQALADLTGAYLFPAPGGNEP